DILAPHVRDNAPTRVGRRLDHAAESVSTGRASPRAAATRPMELPARNAERSAGARTIVPYGTYDLGPKSAPTYKFVYTRPKRPDDKLVCVTGVPMLGKACADPPLPPLPVLQLVPAPPPLPPLPVL